MKEYYYYTSDEDHPLISCCLIFTNPKDYVRGLAYCSKNDNPNKKVGRSIARQRAFYALKYGKNLYSSLYQGKKPINKPCIYPRALYCPTLNNHELRMIKKETLN